jgi:hypothetical protein
VALDALPGALAAPAAVDGLNKRVVMVVYDLTRMLCMPAIPARPSFTTSYVTAAIHSVATVFFQSATSAAGPLIVERDELTFLASVLLVWRVSIRDVGPGTEPTAESWFTDEFAQTTVSWANARGWFEQIGRSNYRKTDVILETTVEKLYEARLRVRDCHHSPGFGTVAAVLQKTGLQAINRPLIARFRCAAY